MKFCESVSEIGFLISRFYSKGMWMEKKTTYVDFPTSGLDLSDCVLGQKPRKPFNLYGVSVSPSFSLINTDFQNNRLFFFIEI